MRAAQLAGTPAGGHEDKSPRPRIGLDRAQEGEDRLHQELLGVDLPRLASDDRQQRSQRRHLLAVDQRQHQPLEVAEQVIDDGAGHAGALRHGLDADRIEAAFGEHVQGGVEELAPPDLRGQTRGSWCWGAHRASVARSHTCASPGLM